MMSKDLYVDWEFECSAYPLGKENDGQRLRQVEWLRPRDIVRARSGRRGVETVQPVFMDHDAYRFDLNQGQIGDCWFIAGVVSLVTSRQKQLIDRCIPPEQSFKHNYTGKFRFKFWHFGEWKEVVIDDMLPTVDGKLIYAINASQPNEFWVPLMEKAYAKLYGGYCCLQGGFPADAIVDMTGGISETVDLNAPDATQSEELFEYLRKIMDACSTATCGILPKSEKGFAQCKSCFESGHGYTVAPHFELRRDPTSSGIILAHAYSIIKLVVVQARRTKRGSFDVDGVKLICLHNPWGQHEWKGSWSDGSDEWDLVLTSTKNEIGYTNKDDGEFWMSFEDFVATFDHIWVCHLPSDPTTKRIAQTENWWQWKHFQKSGTFVAEILYEAELEGLAIISLMQVTTRDENNINMSFQIISASDGRTVAEITGCRREVVKRLELSKDTYYIVPSAASPGDTQFLLRVFARHISVPRY